MWLYVGSNIVAGLHSRRLTSLGSMAILPVIVLEYFHGSTRVLPKKYSNTS